jgi:type II secretory pathway pseudopilin PulG
MRRRVRPRRQPRNGYIAADAIMAMAIVAILLTVLTVAVSRQRRGSERLADSRAAVRLAEETITALQTGAAPPTPPSGVTVQVRPLATQPATTQSAATQPALQAPSGSTWVEVLVTYNGRSGNLAGIVRADAAKGAIK